MSSQIPTSLASPPRKRGSKKGKRCSSNGDDTSRSTKAQRIKGDHAPASKSAAVEHHDESQTASAIATQEPRRSGRAGAGSGGRTQQLKKVAAILEDRPVRSRQSTDLPEDTAANPLAPPAKSVKSGRRGVGKKAGLESLPPPPYTPAAPCQVQTGPALMTPVPVFHERSSGSDQFGFSAPAPALQPVGIPRTEPNLQIPYVAAQEQQKRFLSPLPPELLQQPRSGSLVGPPRLASSRSLESQSLPSHKASVSSRTLGSQLLDPTPFSNSPPSHKTPAPSRALESRSINPTLLGSSLPSRKASVSSRALKSQSINPSLLDNSLPSRKTFQSLPDHRRVVEHTEPSEGDSSSENDKSTSESGAPDETETEHDEVWGATNSRQVAHPGFSKEVQPNLPICHASLPPDHEFQFSRDEDDESAWRNLDNAEPQHGGTSHPSNRLQIDDSRSPDNAEYQERGDTANNTESQPGNAVDVLDRHHQVNGHPSAPDPQALTSVPPQPDGMQETLVNRTTLAPEDALSTIVRATSIDTADLPGQLARTNAVWTEDRLSPTNADRDLVYPPIGSPIYNPSTPTRAPSELPEPIDWEPIYLLRLRLERVNSRHQSSELYAKELSLVVSRPEILQGLRGQDERYNRLQIVSRKGFGFEKELLLLFLLSLTYLTGSEFLIALLAIALVHSDPTLLLGRLYVSVLISRTVSEYIEINETPENIQIRPENPEPQPQPQRPVRDRATIRERQAAHRRTIQQRIRRAQLAALAEQEAAAEAGEPLPPPQRTLRIPAPLTPRNPDFEPEQADHSTLENESSENLNYPA
ncbi:hypothetical protein L210DRAFT_3647429 [Boletus edulis BED1]|uniref:Uncharacterized protein n=1 Tax=Boletus edulis BED1 TaxID=1328754 RepID=A0AAD4BQJ8_BOLED|nr:hypothetical protein L210DRAFT_3647429 [Boletus edulis BED1]